MKSQYKVFSRISFFSLLIIFLIIRCEEEKPVARTYPRLSSTIITNISDSGATCSADLYSLGTELPIEYGFIWGSTGRPDYYHSNKVVIGRPEKTGIFTARINAGLRKDVMYTVIPFVKTIERFVYGPSSEFKSLGSSAPVIYGFEPHTAGWEDTIQIKGKHFSYLTGDNLVKLNNILCDVLASTDTTIIARVGYNLDVIKSVLSVELMGKATIFKSDTFNLIPPVITDFYPKKARWGDSLFISGQRLSSITRPGNYVKLGTQTCPVIYPVSDTTIVIKIPDELITLSSALSLNLNGVVISNQSKFTLEPPEITSFSPEKGLKNSIVTIYGRFNSLASGSIVQIFNANATILYNSRDSIKIRIPANINDITSPIVYNLGPFSVSSTNPFRLVYPIINQIIPLSGQYNEEISIIGENLSSTAGGTQVEFGNGNLISVKSISESKLIVNVPDNIDSIPRKIGVLIGSDKTYSSEYFTLAPPEISSVEYGQSILGSEITIIGTGFNTDPSLSKLYFDNYPLTITSSSNSQMKAMVPKYLPRNLQKIILTTGGYKRSLLLNFELNSQWFQIPVPSYLRSQYLNPYNIIFAFSLNNRGYLIKGGNGAMYSFDPISRSFTSLGEQSIFKDIWDCPISGIVQQDTFYAIGGSTKSYRYNSTLNSWTAIQSPENSIYGRGTAFSIDNVIYYGLACNRNGCLQDGKIYKYDSKNNVWSYKTAFPWYNSSITSYVITSFTTNGKAYFLFSDLFFCEYDPTTNIWTAKRSFPANESTRSEVVSFVVNNKPYVGTGGPSVFKSYDDFYNYDAKLDLWSKANYISLNGNDNFVCIPGGERWGATCFVIDNKVYIGFGAKEFTGLNDFYEFDPIYPLN